jgi:hypothetical protein
VPSLNRGPDSYESWNEKFHRVCYFCEKEVNEMCDVQIYEHNEARTFADCYVFTEVMRSRTTTIFDSRRDSSKKKELIINDVHVRICHVAINSWVKWLSFPK